MKLIIPLFVICLVIKINGETSRLLLAHASKCAAVNCGINPCYQCNPKTGKCSYECCVSNKDCKGQTICINGYCAIPSNPCPAIKCADPCLDPLKEFEPRCPAGVECISIPKTDPVTGCTSCPEFVNCPATRCSTGCGEGWFCCNKSCDTCAPLGGSCTQQMCGPVPVSP
eukprot:UN00129